MPIEKFLLDGENWLHTELNFERQERLERWQAQFLLDVEGRWKGHPSETEH